MVERVQSRRIKTPKKVKRGRGRPKGGESEVKRVAAARARMTGELPHELLLEWGRTGYMEYVRRGGRRIMVELEPSDRIACAKGCAAWYKPAMQPRPAPGEQPPVVRLELDEKMIAALAAKSPDKLDVLRDVFRAIQAGGVDIGQAAGGPAGQVDAGRYGRMLSETSEVDGRA